MFGFPIENAVVYWGARAIYRAGWDEYCIDLLPDRQSCTNLDKVAESNALMFWLNNRALPELRRLVKEKNLDASSREIIEISEFNFILRASPNGSYGYFYIGAAILPVVPQGVVFNTASGKDERVFIANGKRFIFSPEHDVPLPGTKGKIRVNSIGKATCVGYSEAKAGYGDGAVVL